jgi:hypothetical protein
MKSKISAYDIRQSPQWGEYMKSIGWEVYSVNGNLMYAKKMPLLKRPIIKMQHPYYTLDLKKIDEIAKKKKALMLTIEAQESNYSKEVLLKNGYKESKISYAPSN